MDLPAGFPGRFGELAEHGVARERAIGDRLVDADELLHDDPSGPEVQMPDLGVAKLPLWQADRETIRAKKRARSRRPQPIETGGVRECNRIVGPLLAPTPAVEDDENHGSGCLASYVHALHLSVLVPRRAGRGCRYSVEWLTNNWRCAPTLQSGGGRWSQGQLATMRASLTSWARRSRLVRSNRGGPISFGQMDREASTRWR